ncbi:MAG TPA: glycosyltransferase family 4 protein [Patescibacteria group bacterium]|nr:glycosyltransferase family 4 protein [Patescibacteria group bacterium]
MRRHPGGSGRKGHQGDSLTAVKSLLISGAYFPPQTGGISRYMASICATLGREEICCLTGVRLNNGNREREGWPRVYRRPAAFAKAWHAQAPSLALALIQILLRERPGVVQIATTHDGSIGLWLRRRFGLPYMVYAHGNEILGATQSEWEKPRQSLLQASRVLAVSRFTASLVANTGVSPERIEIVHPGCDVDSFRPHQPGSALRERLLGKRRGQSIILSVGNLVSRKGHDMVIRALARLSGSTRELTYLIVGDGPYRSALEELASALGVRDQVVFAGKLAEEELPDAYALCDLFVLTSREQLESCDVEGFGMVFLEANASGKPVVAGRSGGIGDAVVDQETGLLVDPLDPASIAAAVERLLMNHELALRMGELGRERAVREFSWPVVAARIRKILRQVAQEDSRNAALPAESGPRGGPTPIPS